MTSAEMLPPPSFFKQNQPHLVTLLEMIQTETWNLVNHASGITRIRDDMKARYQALRGIAFNSVEVSEQEKENLGAMDQAMRPWLLAHELTASIDRLDRIKEYVAYEYAHVDDLSGMLTIFLEVLEDELRRKSFLFIPPDRDWLFKNPETFWGKTLGAFPSAAHDIREASRCYALGCYTASVYHSMGILQTGLFAVAREIGVSFKHSIELAEWQNIILGIEGKIKLIQQESKSDDKDQKISFFSESAAQFRYFKDAWRNHVAHMRRDCDSGEAWQVLTHVRDFMELISTRLHE